MREHVIILTVAARITFQQQGNVNRCEKTFISQVCDIALSDIVTLSENGEHRLCIQHFRNVTEKSSANVTVIPSPRLPLFSPQVSDQ